MDIRIELKDVSDSYLADRIRNILKQCDIHVGKDYSMSVISGKSFTQRVYNVVDPSEVDRELTPLDLI